MDQSINNTSVAAVRPAHGTDAQSAEARMNLGCSCASLDKAELRNEMVKYLGSSELVVMINARCPFLFSAMPVFVSQLHQRRMEAAVRAIESVIALPAYRERVLAAAPPIAHHDAGGALGVFYGYDFHLNGNEIGLVEINTNAGGAMLNAVMARAHQSCSINAEQLIQGAESGPHFEDQIVIMFRDEWTRCRPGQILKTVAIVDLAPEQQYLYPEFVLFRQLFERHGITAIIADPAALSYREGILWCNDLAVDLVYNRLTDFMLDNPESATLREAYLENAVVLTPNPHGYALYADKRNLALLSSESALEAMGVSLDVQKVILAAVLPTELLNAMEAERFWANRRHLFFKPASGFGGRAAYRGDKVTKRVWQEILGGEYVAQQLMAPGARISGAGEDVGPLKFDLRLYVYESHIQWTAARVYQGQTTNFRTPGGGFAPVYCLPDVMTSCGIACLPPI